MRLFSKDSIEDAVELFRISRMDRLQVENEDGKVIGEFTLNDLEEAVQKGLINESIGKLTTKKNHYPATTRIQRIEENEYKHLIESDVFTDVINSLYDGVYITDGNGITVKINKAYERIADVVSENIIGHHMDKLKEEGYFSQSASLEVIKEKIPITIMQTLHNERTVIVSGTPIFNQADEVLYVVNSVRDITELLRMKLEMDELQELKQLRQSTTEHVENDYIGVSEESYQVYELSKHVAQTDAIVLLQGESGVGKTHIARFIHENSKRQEGPFIELNCGALPPSLIETELFGYVPGAFTDALSKGKKGILEIADQGTLFLDEIGDLPLEIQVKLLKVMEDQAFFPVGSSEMKQIDIRIISATNKDLKNLVEKGRFREDLYYRINVVPILIQPLRERRNDLLPLIQYYLDVFNQKYNYQKALTIEAMDILREYDWPGNIRELRNVIERLVVTTIEDKIDMKDLPVEINPSKQEKFVLSKTILPLKQAVELVEKEIITEAMKKYKTTRKVADVLEVSQSTIVQKMKKWNLTE